MVKDSKDISKEEMSIEEENVTTKQSAKDSSSDTEEEKVKTTNTKSKAKTSAKTKKTTRKSKSSKDVELEKIKQELGETKEKYLRLSAEFDNYRKRTVREKLDMSKTAGENILLQILPVVDDFDRANENIGNAATVDGLKEGIGLIYSKFQDFIKHQGIKEIEAKGLDFDTDIHEAVTKFPAPDESMKGKVIDVVEKGYMLNEKVIRFAKVVVGE